jgi:hypothetical protein
MTLNSSYPLHAAFYTLPAKNGQKQLIAHFTCFAKSGGKKIKGGI